MKNKWLNLVLLLTNRIFDRKQKIIGQTGMGAAYNILVLIFLEILLGLVSIPLYIGMKSSGVVAFFSEKGTYAKINFDYNIRRVITLTGVGIIAAIWATKLLLILVLPAAYGPMRLYAVSDFRPADILSQDLVASEVGLQTARVLNTMTRPALKEVKKLSGGNYSFFGTGQPNTAVVLLLSDEQTAVYTGQADQDGKWQIDHQQNNFRLSEGNHSVLVFGYNKELGVRSETAPEQFFRVSTTWLDALTKNVDVLANWTVVIVILLGIFLTFLTI